LNSLGYKAIEAATVFCKLRGNPHVEMAHWLFQILQNQDSDFTASSATTRSIRRASPPTSRARSTRCRAARPRSPDFSPHIDDAVERGWVYGTLLFKESAVRTGHLSSAC
jgi:type VI secretion system protein VasG